MRLSHQVDNVIHFNAFWIDFGTAKVLFIAVQPRMKEHSMNILQINSSARSTGSESTRMADAIVARLQASHPGARLVRRDLAAEPHPAIDETALQALFTPAAQRSAEQAARVALDDVLIEQAQAADAIVIGAPMYNFGMTVQLKSWFDAIARAGVTFRYGAAGPEGLLKNKKVYVALARGGMHRGGTTDAQVPHLTTLLGFLGMTDVTFVYSEGHGMGPEAVALAKAQADAQIDAVLA
jgi:FMN-dependent NADH-azoreductase